MFKEFIPNIRTIFVIVFSFFFLPFPKLQIFCVWIPKLPDNSALAGKTSSDPHPFGYTMEPQYNPNRQQHQRTFAGAGATGGGSLHMETPRHQPTTTQLQSQHSDKDRTSNELRALDCNLTSLCDHIQLEGFNNGSFSDVIVQAMGSTYHLHRLILSRSSYFRFFFRLFGSLITPFNPILGGVLVF